MDEKTEKGQFYTTGNPFILTPFRHWVETCNFTQNTVLEPFAGNGNIPKLLSDVGITAFNFSLYDIAPKAHNIKKRDTLSSFPEHYNICVTNPPWLAKNSATRKGISLPRECEHDDLYKFALQKCLENCDYVAAIVPESYIRTELFFDRMSDFVSLLAETGKMFDDTEHPVGLALFTPDYNTKTRIWHDNQPIGTYEYLKNYLPDNSGNNQIKFNVPDGNLGLIAIDNTKNASIRFCTASEIPDDYVNYQRRSKTRISTGCEVDIDMYNFVLNEIREKTQDVFLTAFKGIRQDGRYRRRLDFKLARDIIYSIDSTQTTIRI